MYYDLIKLIDENNIISFDIFDTLVFRNVLKPVDIFKIMEKQNKIKNFAKLRIKAEQESRVKENNMETTLDLIYEKLKYYDIKIDIQKIKDQELAVEKEFITINPFMKKIYDYALSKNKLLVICIYQKNF